MFLATSCLFSMYVCRVALVMPDLQFMFAVPLTLGYLEKRSSQGSPRKSLVDKASPTEAAEDTGSGELAGKFQNHHQQWCVLSQLIYLFILKWNVTFSKFL